MCLNCGCGEPEKRHHPTDIVAEDLRRAAQGSGQGFEETARNMRASLDAIAGQGAMAASGSARTSEAGQEQVR